MERRNALIQSLQQHFGVCDLLSVSFGTHMIWRLPTHMPEASKCQSLARTVGITVNSMQLETIIGLEFLPSWDRYLLLGYADLQPETIRFTIERLAQVLS